MPSNVSYPVDPMIQTANEIRQLLDEQWATHTLHFSSASDSYLNLVGALTNRVPGVNGAALQEKLQQWNQQLRACYDALYDLADMIDGGAGRMSDLDTQTARGVYAE
jgi:uncharacterized protein YukE